MACDLCAFLRGEASSRVQKRARFAAIERCGIERLSRRCSERMLERGLDRARTLGMLAHCPSYEAPGEHSMVRLVPCDPFERGAGVFFACDSQGKLSLQGCLCFPDATLEERAAHGVGE
jgi:hypothetical protein